MMGNEIYSALIGACGAILLLWIGSKQTKVQRIREELYSHKVKAYAKLAELIAEVRQEYEILAFMNTGSDVVPFDKSRSPIEIDGYFRKNLFLNILFLSPKTKSRMEHLSDKITNSSRLTFNHSAIPDLVSSDDLRKCYEDMINECNLEIQKLYIEIGLDKI
ncbi:hypothetical protein [Chryseobacterium sp. SL1]|uniref:hypothetical protein n=1 Tax=Chryseobacterium sp. SL1 TaxID=2995159 RepID=UPI002276B87A|nr:hypothetical protein [Chryseobacterium sp. SL1]MCY1660334.1 hypothetical protein [Chryseobacterium sp. SL1]